MIKLENINPSNNIVNALIMMAKYAYPDEYKDIEVIGN